MGLAADEALRRVDTAVGNRLLDQRVNHGQVDITVVPENLVEVVTALRDLDFLSCRFFTFMTGIDRSEFTDEPGGLEVLIHLYSVEHIFHVNVHVPVDSEEPICPSITGLFLGARWQERECHEMFGIEFEGNSNLSNLMLPEDFEGNPLRRSFKLPSRFVKGWPGAKDPEEASAGGR
jgi:NADH-quinone oxidoreductase subunit C